MEEKEDLILNYLIKEIGILKDLALNKTNSNKFPTRIVFLQLKRYIEKYLSNSGDRLIILPGLRGVGKTTLLYQLYLMILEKNIVEQDHVLYLSCDILVEILNTSIDEVLRVYENKIIGEAFEIHKKKIILLIDEAHYDEKWQIVAKKLEDRSNILLFISGSLAISLETNTDLTRRLKLERIFPLSFMEYNLLKHKVYPVSGLSKDLRDALFNSKDVEDAFNKINPLIRKIRLKYKIKFSSYDNNFENYLISGGIPATINLNEKDVFEKLFNVLRKVVDLDIPQYSKISKKVKDLIFPVLNILASSQDKISYRSITSNINDLDLPELYKIIEALKKSGILQSINISSDSVMKIERNSKRFYFATPSIRAALLWKLGKFNRDTKKMGIILENAVYNSLFKTMSYTNLIQNISYPKIVSKNSDFVVETTNGKIIIEVGWGNKDTEQAKESILKENANFAIIVANNSEKLLKKDSILYIPKDIFLLL